MLGFVTVLAIVCNASNVLKKCSIASTIPLSITILTINAHLIQSRPRHSQINSMMPMAPVYNWFHAAFGSSVQAVHSGYRVATSVFR